MNSPIKLPPLPAPLREIAYMGGRPQDVYGIEEMRAYAEQAVRDDLAAQEPVAWVMQVGTHREFITNSKVLLATLMGYHPKPLAIIPENNHE